MKILLLAALLLTACAAPTHKPEKRVEISEAHKEEWVAETRKWLRDSDRLESVSFRVLTKGINYCKTLDHTTPYLGVQFWSNQQLQPEWREVALSKLNLGSEPQISLVVPSSPADSAGLRANDRVVEINGVATHTIPDTWKIINETVAAGNPVTFTIQRADERQMISVMPIMACKSRVAMVIDNAINMAADGEAIQITSGLLHFAESDEEIAAIVSHQLAHNARKHPRTNNTVSVLGAVLGAIPGLAADVALAVVTGGGYTSGSLTQLGWTAGGMMGAGNSTSQLKQADQDSLHLMAMAGYAIEDVPAFWHRVQEFNEPEGINGLRNSHPFSQERFLAMETTQREIKEKIQSGNSPYALNF